MNNLNNNELLNSDIDTQKKRGRKKKNPEQNINDTDDKNLETLQIEQVKKKRGRKKKWEVETTTKLIENGPITFSENNNKEEIKEIDDNYDSQNILFGNLNIKVHSNKDTLQIDDIKQTLKNNNNTNENVKCKINLSDSDYEDSDDDNNNININIDNNKKLSKMNKQKKKIIEKNIKVMKFYENEYDAGNEIIMSSCRCYHCHHHFNNKPFFLPIDFNSDLKRFRVTGNFCSPNCVKSYSSNSKIYSKNTYLVGFMYRQLFGAYYKIKPAPPIQCLKEYGGNLTIEQYRENFDNNKVYKLKNICCKVQMDEIIDN
jgi:hypothetical protein